MGPPAGASRGVIRVATGEVDGLRPTRSRGPGVWVREVLVWTKAPLLFRSELLSTDGAEEQRSAGAVSRVLAVLRAALRLRNSVA